MSSITVYTRSPYGTSRYVKCHGLTPFPALACFAGWFEWVFEHDWTHTKSCLAHADRFIDPQDSFLVPAQFDEASNWTNRAALLEAYRQLAEAMLRQGLRPRLTDDPADELN